MERHDEYSYLGFILCAIKHMANGKHLAAGKKGSTCHALHLPHLPNATWQRQMYPWIWCTPYVSCYPIWAVTQFELLLWAFWPSVPKQVQKLNWCIGSFWSSCCLSERALSSSRAYSIRIFAFLVHLCQEMCCHNSRQPAWQSDIEIATSFPLHDCNDSLCLTTCCIWHNVSVI